MAQSEHYGSARAEPFGSVQSLEHRPNPNSIRDCLRIIGILAVRLRLSDPETLRI